MEPAVGTLKVYASVSLGLEMLPLMTIGGDRAAEAAPPTAADSSVISGRSETAKGIGLERPAGVGASSCRVDAGSEGSRAMLIFFMPARFLPLSWTATCWPRWPPRGKIASTYG